MHRWLAKFVVAESVLVPLTKKNLKISLVSEEIDKPITKSSLVE